jgi:hypothetical protein
MLSNVEEEERGGIPKRYGRGLYSTRRTKTPQVPGFEFDGFDQFVTGRGRGCCQPSLPLLVECDLWVYLYMNDGLFQEARKSANMDGERATLARLGWPPNSYEEA